MGWFGVPFAAGRPTTGRFNWGPDGPPDEAYSRVTEPERFLPLVDWTPDLLSRLEDEYDVVREEAYAIDTDLERTAAVQPIVLTSSAKGRRA